MFINASKIEIILADRELTRKTFSILCGISPQSISTIIHRGTCAPKTANKMARALGLTVEDIIDEVK